jgi:hypothetical protein
LGRTLAIMTKERKRAITKDELPAHMVHELSLKEGAGMDLLLGQGLNCFPVTRRLAVPPLRATALQTPPWAVIAITRVLVGQPQVRAMMLILLRRPAALPKVIYLSRVERMTMLTLPASILHPHPTFTAGVPLPLPEWVSKTYTRGICLMGYGLEIMIPNASLLIPFVNMHFAGDWMAF